MTLPYRLGVDDISQWQRVHCEIPIPDDLKAKLEDIWRRDMDLCESMSAELIEVCYDYLVEWADRNGNKPQDRGVHRPEHTNISEGSAEARGASDPSPGSVPIPD